MCLDPNKHKPEDLPKPNDSPFGLEIKREIRNSDHTREAMEVLKESGAIIEKK